MPETATKSCFSPAKPGGAGGFTNNGQSYQQDSKFPHEEQKSAIGSLAVLMEDYDEAPRVERLVKAIGKKATIVRSAAA